MAHLTSVLTKIQESSGLPSSFCLFLQRSWWPPHVFREGTDFTHSIVLHYPETFPLFPATDGNTSLVLLKIMCSRLTIIDWGCQCWGKDGFKLSQDIELLCFVSQLLFIFWIDHTWFTSLTYRVLSIYPLPSSFPKELLCKACPLNRNTFCCPGQLEGRRAYSGWLKFSRKWNIGAVTQFLWQWTTEAIYQDVADIYLLKYSKADGNSI